MIGESIGNFAVVARLGGGGMGEIWLAEHKSVHTKVAIKILRSEVSKELIQVKRFFNEAVAVGKIHHAGIAKIFDFGFHTDGQAYLVMEYLEGETLAVRVHQRGKLPVAQVVDVGRQIAGVLEATHGAGITHRDLKPDNIFLVPDPALPSGERVKVLDFGVAKLGDSVGLTSSVSALGTPLYMSPEQWRNPTKANSRSDVYSLGCVMFEMACGRPPFQAETLGEACSKHLTQPPPSPHTLRPDLPASLDDLVLRLLKKKPSSRPTIRELAETLETIARDAPPELARASLPDLRAATSTRADPHAATLLTSAGKPPSPAAVTTRSGASPVLPLVLVAVVIAGAAAAILASRGSGVLAPRIARSVPDAGVVVRDAGVPAQPLLVSSRSLTRIAGDTPQPRRGVQITYCIDKLGRVTSVQVPDDAADDVAKEVRTRVATWRHLPFKRDGKVVPFCAITHIDPKQPVRAPK